MVQHADIDHTGLGGGAEPWLVLIDVRAGSTGHTNWNTPFVDAAMIGAADMESGGAQNDEIYWHVELSTGTWTFRLLHNQGANRGIYHVRVDDVDKGTIDGYLANPGLKNVFSQVAGVAITGGKRKVALKMATKHASSSAYFGTAITLLLIRTA